MKNPEEQDDLWQLLGNAKKPSVSPFFASNVLREIRSTRPEKAGLLAWLRMQWRPVLLSGAAAVLLAMNAAQIFSKHEVGETPAPQPSVAVTTQGKNDYEIIKNLDELLAYEEHSIWLDDPKQ